MAKQEKHIRVLLMRDLDKLILQIYGLVRSVPMAEFQNRVFEILQPIFEFDNAIWGVGTRAEQGGFISSVHLFRQSEAMMENYAKVRQHDGVAESVENWPGRTMIFSLNGPELADRRFAPAREHGKRFGMSHILCTSIPEPDLGLSHVISLYRRDEARNWSEALRAMMQQLMPHLVEAYLLLRCLYLEHKNDGHTICGYATADKTLALVNITPDFRRLLLLEWPHWPGPQLTPEAHKALMGEAKLFVGCRIVLEVTPVEEIVYLLVRPKTGWDLLSKHEAMVARLFAQGLSNKEVAARLKVSPHTIRNQLKTVYTKLGVHDKVALAGLLRNSPRKLIT